MSYADATEEMLEDIRALFADALPETRPLVTDDPVAAAAETAAGGPVLLLGPPDMTFPAFARTVHEWTLLATAGTTDRPAAAAVLGPLVDALREPLGLDRATPAEFSPPNSAGRAWPGYLLTFTTHTDD